jgi:Flp pilus assembly protein TadG
MILSKSCNSRGTKVVQKSCRGACTGRYRDSGQTLIEIAILVPVLMFFTLGIVELGRYGYVSILVGNAARAGTAYGTQSLPQSVDAPGILTAARNDYRRNGQDPLTLAVTSTVSCGCDVGGGIISASCTGSGAGVCATGRWVAVLSVSVSRTLAPLFAYTQIQPIRLTSTSKVRIRAV